MVDDVAERSTQVADGRTVGWTEYGPADGRPLLRLPGTPGSRWNIRADRTPWAERGLRVLTTERPGYGVSTRLPGRRFSQHSDDLAHVLDVSGIDRAWVTGASGAAPHILSFAARHPDRVRAITILAGAAPTTDEQVGQMIELNQTSHHLCQARDVAAMTTLLEELRTAILEDPVAGFRSSMQEAPAEDQAIMDDPRVAGDLHPLDQGVPGPGHWRLAGRVPRDHQRLGRHRPVRCRRECRLVALGRRPQRAARVSAKPGRPTGRRRAEDLARWRSLRGLPPRGTDPRRPARPRLMAVGRPPLDGR